MPLALIAPLIRRDKGDTVSLLVQFLLEPWVPRAPPPASLPFSRLSWLAATGPTLYFLRVFLFPPKSPPFPTWCLQLLCGFVRFFASPPPSPILSSSPFPFPSSSPFPSCGCGCRVFFGRGEASTLLHRRTHGLGPCYGRVLLPDSMRYTLVPLPHPIVGAKRKTNILYCG